MSWGEFQESKDCSTLGSNPTRILATLYVDVDQYLLEIIRHGILCSLLSRETSAHG